jgi:hypothetical protein
MHQIVGPNRRIEVMGCELVRAAVYGCSIWNCGTTGDICVAIAVELELDELDVYKTAELEEFVPFAVYLGLESAEGESEVFV